MLCLYLPHFMSVIPADQIRPAWLYTFLACYYLHHEFLDLLRLLLLCNVTHTDISSTMCAIIVSEEHFELTKIYPAHEVCTILLCQSISSQALRSVGGTVQSSISNIQFGAARLLYLGLVHESHVANLVAFSLEIGCLALVMIVGIGLPLYVLYSSIDIFLLSLQLS